MLDGSCSGKFEHLVAVVVECFGTGSAVLRSCCVRFFVVELCYGLAEKETVLGLFN